MLSQFSSFGKPILPASGHQSQMPSAAVKKVARERVSDNVSGQGKSFFSVPWLLGIPFGLLLLALLFVLVYPYDNFRPSIELATSRLLQSPVRIGAVSLSLWPRPELTLSAIKIGEDAGATVEQIRVASPLGLLGSGQHTLVGVRVIGATLPADFLVASRLFQVPSSVGDGRLAIHQLSFEKLTVTALDLALRDLSGEIAFKPGGAIEKAVFENISAGIRLQAMPTAEGVLLDIEGFGWKPLGEDFGFASLQAKGMLQKGRLAIASFDTSFLNGILRGSWLLDWGKNGLVMAGDATMQRLDCRKISILAPSLKLEGELGGSLRLRASGKDWGSLWGGVEAHLDADIARGVLHGVDLGEVVRRGTGYVVRSGSTKFDRLRATVIVDPRQVAGRNLQMSAGMVTASGQFVVSRQRSLEASLVVTMQTSVSTVRTPVRVSGILPEMSAVSGK